MLNQPFLYIGLLLALWQPRAANANESAMDAVDDREGGIQAVTVTARRVEEDSQHVPVAVTVVSGSQLQDHGLFTTESLGQLAPGLTVTQAFGSRDLAYFNIRGQLLESSIILTRCRSQTPNQARSNLKPALTSGGQSECLAQRRAYAMGGTRAAPRGRAFTNESLEEPGQVRLIGEPTLEGDLTQWRAGREHQPLRAFHSTHDEKGVRRATEAIAKRPHEVRQTQLGQRGQVSAMNGLAQVLLNVGRDAANLPGCEPATTLLPLVARDGSGGLPIRLASTERGGCRAEMLPRVMRVAQERAFHRVD